MDTKIFLILILAMMLCFGFIMLVGTIHKQSLNEDNDKIESLEDVEKFIEDCNDKIFLNCDELLLRKIRK